MEVSANSTSLPAADTKAFWLEALTVAVIAVIYFGSGVFDHDIWSPTEPTFSGVVRNMVRYGSFAVPRINEFPYLEKPPLSYWLAWLTCQANGHLTAACLRLPSAIFGFISLGLLYWVARKRNDTVAACVVVLLAATSIEFYQLSHRAGADILAVFFVFLCFALFSVTLLQDRASRSAILAFDMSFAAALALSFYAKNFFTFLVVLPPVVLFLFYKREFGRLSRCVAWIAVFTVLAILPWALALYREGGWEYLRVVFFDNTIGRFVNLPNFERFNPGPLNDAFTVQRRSNPFFYLRTFWWIPAPWSLIFLASLISLFRRGAADDFRIFLKLAIVIVPVVLTLSVTKSPDYLVPLLFIMLLIIGEFIRDLFSDSPTLTRLEDILCRINVIIVVAVLVLAPAGLAWYFHRPILYCLTALIALGFAWLARQVWGERSKWRFVYGFTWLSTLAMLLTSVAVFPILNIKNSYAPFFERVRDQSRNRELYTTLLDDRRLPLVEFYLDRRVPIIRDDEKLFQLLNSGASVGVILDQKNYERLKKAFALIPHQLIVPANDKPPLVLINNR